MSYQEVEEKLFQARSAMIREIVLDNMKKAKTETVNPETEEVLLRRRSTWVVGLAPLKDTQKTDHT